MRSQGRSSLSAAKARCDYRSTVNCKLQIPSSAYPSSLCMCSIPLPLYSPIVSFEIPNPFSWMSLPLPAPVPRAPITCWNAFVFCSCREAVAAQFPVSCKGEESRGSFRLRCRGLCISLIRSSRVSMVLFTACIPIQMQKTHSRRLISMQGFQ